MLESNIQWRSVLKFMYMLWILFLGKNVQAYVLSFVYMLLSFHMEFMGWEKNHWDNTRHTEVNKNNVANTSEFAMCNLANWPDRNEDVYIFTS
jgi:hypothetical protein